jgi:hypothetical protein
MRLKHYVTCTVGLAALLSCGLAKAGSVTAELVSVSGDTFNLVVQNSAGTNTDTGGGGLFHWDGSAGATGGLGGGNNTPGYGGAFTTFCTDIKDFVSTGTVFTYNPAPTDIALAPINNGTGQTFNADLTGGMGSVKASLLSLLYGQHYANGDATSSAANSAAFQLAVWKIVYSPVAATLASVNLSAYDVTHVGTGFYVTGANSGETNQANGWLQGLNLNGTGMSLAALSSPTYQDQIVVVPPPPAVYAGLALAASCLIWRRLRRNDEVAI